MERRPFCTVMIPITPERRHALQLACKRLDLSWAQIVWRVQCAMQDAATRTLNQLVEAPHPPREQTGDQGKATGTYPDCTKCWAMRAETCGECGRGVEWYTTCTADKGRSEGDRH